MKKKSVFFIFIPAITFSLLLPSCMFFGPSSYDLYKAAEKKMPYDAIIVPGVPYDSAVGQWSDVMMIRVYWSKYLYDKGITKNVIYSGSAVYTPYIEGEIMALYGEALGIPKEHIYSETKAEHSTENIYYSYAMAKKLGFTKIAIATDPYQSRLLRRYPRGKKMEIDFIPIIIDTLRAMDKKHIPVEVEKARVKTFTSIVDRETRFKRLLGTLGKNIKKTE